MWAAYLAVAVPTNLVLYRYSTMQRRSYAVVAVCVQLLVPVLIVAMFSGEPKQVFSPVGLSTRI